MAVVGGVSVKPSSFSARWAAARKAHPTKREKAAAKGRGGVGAVPTVTGVPSKDIAYYTRIDPTTGKAQRTYWVGTGKPSGAGWKSVSQTAYVSRGIVSEAQRKFGRIDEQALRWIESQERAKGIAPGQQKVGYYSTKGKPFMWVGAPKKGWEKLTKAEYERGVPISGVSFTPLAYKGTKKLFGPGVVAQEPAPELKRIYRIKEEKGREYFDVGISKPRLFEGIKPPTPKKITPTKKEEFAGALFAKLGYQVTAEKEKIRAVKKGEEVIVAPTGYVIARGKRIKPLEFYPSEVKKLGTGVMDFHGIGEDLLRRYRAIGEQDIGIISKISKKIGEQYIPKITKDLPIIFERPVKIAKEQAKIVKYLLWDVQSKALDLAIKPAAKPVGWAAGLGEELFLKPSKFITKREKEGWILSTQEKGARIMFDVIGKGFGWVRKEPKKAIKTYVVGRGVGLILPKVLPAKAIKFISQPKVSRSLWGLWAGGITLETIFTEPTKRTEVLGKRLFETGIFFAGIKGRRLFDPIVTVTKKKFETQLFRKMMKTRVLYKAAGTKGEEVAARRAYKRLRKSYVKEIFKDILPKAMTGAFAEVVRPPLEPTRKVSPMEKALLLYKEGKIQQPLAVTKKQLQVVWGKETRSLIGLTAFRPTVPPKIMIWQNLPRIEEISRIERLKDIIRGYEKPGATFEAVVYHELMHALRGPLVPEEEILALERAATRTGWKFRVEDILKKEGLKIPLELKLGYVGAAPPKQPIVSVVSGVGDVSGVVSLKVKETFLDSKLKVIVGDVPGKIELFGRKVGVATPLIKGVGYRTRGAYLIKSILGKKVEWALVGTKGWEWLTPTGKPRGFEMVDLFRPRKPKAFGITKYAGELLFEKEIVSKLGLKTYKYGIEARRFGLEPISIKKARMGLELPKQVKGITRSVDIFAERTIVGLKEARDVEKDITYITGKITGFDITKDLFDWGKIKDITMKDITRPSKRYAKLREKPKGLGLELVYKLKKGLLFAPTLPVIKQIVGEQYTQLKLRPKAISKPPRVLPMVSKRVRAIMGAYTFERISPLTKTTGEFPRVIQRPAYILKPISIPLIKPITKPMLKTTLKPILKPALKPALKLALESILKPALKPALKLALKPALKLALKPALKLALKPALKPALRPALKPTTKLLFEPYFPPPPPAIMFPFKRGKIKRYKLKKKFKRIHKWQPSLVGIQKNRKKIARDFLTGFEVRGIPNVMEKVLA